ncbi:MULTISPECIES: enoyl-CoA hydratase-related protein [unclassified Pseudonocardia]|uniref:enoyl-CoA hydratase/isomerase family protein n=1 Tax=unclassified Pseudonocardia TaxID=2619320 RepID=UPI00192B2CB0|nr:enoyl-CoA hydratase-related protein [Pseudonocardia sp. Ae707_Ps1]
MTATLESPLRARLSRNGTFRADVREVVRIATSTSATACIASSTGVDLPVASRTIEGADRVGADGEVTYVVDDALAVLTLDRPEADNALTLGMLRDLAEGIAAAVREEVVQAIVIVGAGERAFCAGGDLGELLPRLTDGELGNLVPGPDMRFMSDVDKPVIAAANGACVAAGLELLLGTDIRVAADHAVFGLHEVRWGLVPGGGSHARMPRQVPRTFAMKLLLTGDHVPAQRAFEAGLIDEAIPGADVFERALTIGRRIAENAPFAARTTREVAVRALNDEPRFVPEHVLNPRGMSSDAREGPRTSLRKRPLEFHGR